MSSFKYLKSFYNIFLEKPYGMLLSFGLFMIVFRLNNLVLVNTDFATTKIIAPFIEEAARFLSIAFGGFTYYFFTPFMALTEFFMYVFRTPNLTHQYITLRVICVGVHFLCFFVQYRWYKKYLETNDFGFAILAYLSGVLVHLSYNTFFTVIVGTVVSKFITT